ncbi:MAG: hypothetical protein V1849_04200, partial [Chloroflexota bacterium]
MGSEGKSGDVIGWGATRCRTRLPGGLDGKGLSRQNVSKGGAEMAEKRNLKTGDAAPDFTLKDQSGKEFR